jgi:hypothetical protein
MIKFHNAMFWTDDTDILYCEFTNQKHNHKLDVDFVKFYIDAITNLCNGKAMPFLIDLRGSRGTFSISAAKLLAKDSELIKLRISESFVTNTIGIKLLITTYKRLYDPITPFGIFNNIEDAKIFCNAYKNEVEESI